MMNENVRLGDIKLRTALNEFGLDVEIHSGHLRYHSNFKPLKLTTQIAFIRHGETYGNCGQITSEGRVDQELIRLGVKDKMKRVFQGYVDTEANQLTLYGKEQALQVAEKLQQQYVQCGWIPDEILHSPLNRALETALPFIEQNHFYDRYKVEDQLKEMSFGAWDNRRLCDFEEKDICHLFYRDQNALVKQSGINGNGCYHLGENFCELLLRVRSFYIQLEQKFAGKRVILFSHSMVGAASMILFGKGQTVEDGDYLAFDGKRKDHSDYTMPHATPFLLNE